MKLLLVDDQEHVLRLERMVLITDGFDVETASGGREALEKLKGTRYDGLVLDMLMPEIDGCEVVRQLRSIALNRRAPVIMVTASPESGMRQRAFEAGAAAFINKPFTAEAFRSVIRGAIGVPQQPSSVLTPAAPACPPPPARARVAPESPVPSVAAPPPPASGPVASTRTPTWRRPKPAVGTLVVRSDTGETYTCPPHPNGGWQCGRCEVGLITAEEGRPSAGSSCTVCHAEVVRTEPGRGRGRWWPF